MEEDDDEERDLTKDLAKKSKKPEKNPDSKQYKIFTTDDCDEDYGNDRVNQVKYHKIKLASGINIVCHLFEAKSIKNYLGSDFPAITIEKKCKDDKCYELTVPLNIGFSIVKAIYKFAELNPESFKNMPVPRMISSKN